MTFLRHQGYSPLEKAYIYGGAVLGAAAPIVGARYAFCSNSLDNFGGEALAWGGAVLINILPLVAKHPPIPFYTMSKTLG